MTKNSVVGWATPLLLFLWIIPNTPSRAQTIDIRAYKMRLSDVMEQIGEKAKKKVVLNTDQNPLISIGSKDANLQDTLKKIENLYGFQFDVSQDQIVVKDKPAETGKNGRGLASIDDASKDPSGLLEMRASGFRYRTIPMNNIDPAKVIKQIKNIIGDQVKTTDAKDKDAAKLDAKTAFMESDDKNKTIVLYSDEPTFRLVKQLCDDLDVAPAQVLLSAKMVEATDSFSRDIGVVLQRNAGTSGGIFSSSNPSASQNGSLEYTFGIIDSVGLDAQIAAGESKGVAKIISNPQLVTSDNQDASLNSGLTYNVRVSNIASSGTTSGSQPVSGVVAGGLQEVTAGLKIDVTPKVLRDGKVDLKIDVNSSSVDTGSSVDGIPGINSTEAKNEMIVRQGQTAAIGGLYKYTNDTNDSGIPMFMDVPIFGFLFKDDTKSKTRQQVMAFITPTIVDSSTEKSLSFEAAKKEAESTPLEIPKYK